MSKQKTSHETEVDNICITNGNESQNNVAVNLVITAFVVANMIAFTMGGVSGSPSSISRGIVETRDMAIIEYPSLNVGIIENDKKRGYIIPQAKIENGKTLVYGETSNDISQNENAELRRKIAMLKNRLSNSLPVHAIIYITVSSVVAAVSVCLLLLRYLSGVYTIDPYFIICAFIIAITLLGTASVSLKDWKRFLDEE
jgi:hypothetical protein